MSNTMILDAGVDVGTVRAPRKFDNSIQQYVDLDPRQVFLGRLQRDGTSLCHVEIAHGADMYHRNFLEYLQNCWRDHLGVVVTPDMLWNTVLSEVDPDPSATATVDGREFEIEPYTRAHVLPAKLDDRGRADPSSPIVKGYRCPCDECQRGVGDYAPKWKVNP